MNARYGAMSLVVGKQAFLSQTKESVHGYELKFWF